MTTLISAKRIAWSMAIILAILVIPSFSANAQVYPYGAQYNVPFFGNLTPAPTAPTYYERPVYYPPVYYNPVNVSCYASPTSVVAGGTATWTAYASGGNGIFSYSWSGDENLYGSGQSIYKSYGYAGQKYASVTVYSNGQSMTRACSNSVSVTNPYIYSYPYQTPVYQYQYQQQYPVSNNAGLDIGCYADPKNAKVNQPITWIVEVTGGAAPYTYAWTGSDGLTGSQSSVIKYYSTSGSKSAIVTVTSADGRTNSRACTNQVTVASNASAYKAPVKAAVKPVVATPTPEVTASAASTGFSLKYVPWAWVAIIVILVLFATVLYLLFNKDKI